MNRELELFKAEKAAWFKLDFSLLRTTDETLFPKGFNLRNYTHDLIDLPVKFKKTITFIKEGIVYHALLVPIKENKEVPEIKGYFLLILEKDTINEIALRSNELNHLKSSLQLIKVNLNDFIMATDYFLSTSQRSNDILTISMIQKQYFYLKRILVLYSNLSEIFEDVPNRLVVINLLEYLRNFQQKSLDSLTNVKRNLNLNMPDTQVFIKVDVQRFTKAIMNLVQNAFLFSPNDSSITISVTLSDSNFVKIEINNSFIEEQVKIKSMERCGLGQYVARRIIESFRGELHFKTHKNQFTSQVLLPIVKIPSSGELHDTLDDYLQDGYNPVNLFLNEVNEMK